MCFDKLNNLLMACILSVNTFQDIFDDLLALISPMLERSYFRRVRLTSLNAHEILFPRAGDFTFGKFCFNDFLFSPARTSKILLTH
jgi:hypothetical protein